MTLPDEHPKPKRDDDRLGRERNDDDDDHVKDAPTRGGSNLPNAGKDPSESRTE